MTEFGFDWFAITEIVIREQCFFGDFCITNPADYNSSNYGLQSTWPIEVVSFIDAPAIVSLNVYKNTQTGWVEVANSPFTNNTVDADYGVGSPVCVQYPDNLSIDGEEFKVVLNILIQQGTNFVLAPFHIWYFTDDEMIVAAPPTSDGVVDFVLGSCNLSDTDLQLTLPVIGALIDGGVVFYIAPTPTDLDGDGNLDIGLACAITPQDDGFGATWYNGVFITTGATGTAIGTGHSNTATIISVQGAGTYGATLCAAYGDGNWFLPSKDELNEIDINRVTIDATAIANGGIALPLGLHLSSSEFDETHAWYDLNGNPQSTFQKDLQRYVRAVRAF